MAATATYPGPHCPRCATPLGDGEVDTGPVMCRSCHRTYEATVFTPPQRRIAAVTTLATAGPEEAGACANHARNAAVTSCQRCGLFICSLCDLDVGEGSICPSCFERVRSAGSLREAVSRYRDYASMARTAAIIGLLFIVFFGVVFGAVAIYYAYKGLEQRRREGRSTAGMVITMLIGVAEVLGGIGMIGMFIFGLMNGGGS